MFCDKPSVNQLTALLLAHDIRHIVVCPGSRNAPLVHNFTLCEQKGEMRLYPVTDERSAAFVALGIGLDLCAPVAVCVTSGTALLNTLPAIAEASQRHVPLLMISADRPQEWIGQLDGQTLPQCGALQPYASTFQLTEDNLIWNNRLINEALCSLVLPFPKVVHLNVPLSEPLFSFTTQELPTERRVKASYPSVTTPLSEELLREIAQAQYPVLFFGHYDGGSLPEIEEIEAHDSLLILAETISQQHPTHHLSDYRAKGFQPDLVIHIGGNSVDKPTKLWLRQSAAKVVRVEEKESFPDTFLGLDTIVYAPLRVVLNQLSKLPRHPRVAQLKSELTPRNLSHFTEWTEQSVVFRLRQATASQKVIYHLANSSAVRLYDTTSFVEPYQRVFCNRGMNGIEGSLSVAVGYSLVSEQVNYCIIGDLSFFYDNNALWNQRLRGNLRILLLNNSGGRIFDHLPGLSASPAQAEYVSANHQVSAKGICESYNIRYLSAKSKDELFENLSLFTATESARPILLETFF